MGGGGHPGAGSALFQFHTGLIKGAGFTFGDTIPKEWFMDKFGLEAAKTAKELDEVRMIYAKRMGELRAKLLVEKKMALKSKAGIGQEIVKPSEQTKWAMDEARFNISREIERATDRIINVDHGRLSQAEKQENSDAFAKLSFFARKNIKQLDW